MNRQQRRAAKGSRLPWREAREKLGRQKIAASKDNGRPMCVIRPSDPALAIELAKVSVEQE